MRIGDFEINGGAALAPMAGVADRAFREICIEFGAAYVVTEMVSSKGLTMHDKKSGLLMQLGESERPAAVQIFGCDPDTMAQAAKQAAETGCRSGSTSLISIWAAPPLRSRATAAEAH